MRLAFLVKCSAHSLAVDQILAKSIVGPSAGGRRPVSTVLKQRDQTLAVYSNDASGLSRC